MGATEKNNHHKSVVASTSAGWMVWAVLAAFGTYFCMYAFRKPFTAASYTDLTVAGMSLKSVLIVSQVLGYMLSKFIGIKVIAEMPPERRAISIAMLIGLAELALILFGIVPRPWNALCMFLNGLPLGMVFGLVLGFLEGRCWTEALTAGLCASFILADGATKSVGAWLLKSGVSENWMPSAAGGLFLVPLGVFVWMLSKTPPPSLMDMDARTERWQMSRTDRLALVRRHALAMSMLILMYLLVSILRSLRADFAPEIWKALGAEALPSTFTLSEIWVALGVVAISGSGILIRDNRRAFFVSLLTCAAGFVLVALAILGRGPSGPLSPFGFMVLVGLGLYIPYVTMHTTVFERLLAMTKDRGNLGFLMYLADSIGYLGYVAVLLTRNSVHVDERFLRYFVVVCWVACVVSWLSLAVCWRYYARRSFDEQCPATAIEGVEK